MSETPLSLVEEHLYQELFLHQLNWSAPDSPPISYTADDGQTYTATNVSSFKGLRVWVCDEKPGSKIEAELDRLIAKTTTDRLVIFHNDDDQVWRWPARRAKENSTSTRLTSHRHRNGRANPNFAARLDAIRLPIDIVLDANAVLTKVREAFDVEARNESKRASKLMARMYSALETAYSASYDAAKRDHEISIILARILFLMFGDDTEMWEDQHGVPVADAFLEFVHLQTPTDASTLGEQLTDLFEALDKPGGAAASGINAVLPYINGGLFREKITLPALSKDFREAVLDACAVNWSTISPAIFGSMFQSVRDAQTRRELGEHYTSEENILKTLNPLFLDELRTEFDRARTTKDEKGVLTRLWKRIGDIRYMDPACGCGNFIIVAFRELRDLELRIMERLQELAGVSQLAFDPTLALKVTLDHFYGIEIDEWPARIAETAMFLVDRQCDLKLKEHFGEAPQRLPIQTQATIVATSALAADWTSILAPTKDVVIAGNPPFLGISLRSDEQTAELQKVWGLRYHGTLDYVTGWYAKAMDYFKNEDGRWAFVSTNSITQGEVVAPLFGAIFDSGWRIGFAHRTFRWTSEAVGGAAVHCVIVGFQRNIGKPRLFAYETIDGKPIEVAGVDNITPYLTEGPTVIVKPTTHPLNPQLGEVLYGNKPTDNGCLIVEPADYKGVVADPIAAKYVRKFVGARELLHNTDRHCLWLVDTPQQDINDSPILKERVEGVRKFRSASRAASTREAASSAQLFRQIAQPDVAYLCIPRHVSENRPYFLSARYDADVICSDANFLSPDADGFVFAIISSTMFITWQKTVGGRIKSDLRFNKLLTWNTFPLPHTDQETRARIINAGKSVLVARSLQPDVALADLYTPEALTAELIAAHDALDKEVDQLFSVKADDHTELRRQHILFQRYTDLTVPPLEQNPTGRRRRG